MATRRTPPRRRPRKESSGTKNVLVGGALLIALGLVVGTIMAHRHDKAHPKHVHAVAHQSSPPGQHPRISLLPPVRPETMPPLASHPKATPHVIAHHIVHQPVKHPEPKYTRFPVTPEMLLGEAAHPRYDTPNPEPLTTVKIVATARPTLAPTATPVPPTPSPTPAVQPTVKSIPHHLHSQVHLPPNKHRYPHPAPTVESLPIATPVPTATHWHPRAHWTARPHWTPIPKWTPHEIPNEIDTAPPNAEATMMPLSLHKASHGDALRAEGVVRRYLTALKHGDEATAYRYLGGAPGDPGLSLSEEGFIDRSAEISSLKIQSDPQGHNIQAEVAAKRGLYIVTFRVEKRGSRQVITSHDYFKP